MEPPPIRPRCIKQRDPSSISVDPERFVVPSPSQMGRKVLAAAIHGQPRQQLDPSVDASAAHSPPTISVDSWPFLDPALHGRHLFRSSRQEDAGFTPGRMEGCEVYGVTNMNILPRGSIIGGSLQELMRDASAGVLYPNCSVPCIDATGGMFCSQANVDGNKEATIVEEQHDEGYLAGEDINNENSDDDNNCSDTDVYPAVEGGFGYDYDDDDGYQQDDCFGAISDTEVEVDDVVVNEGGKTGDDDSYDTEQESDMGEDNKDYCASALGDWLC